jgi:hypothetical protein
MLSDWHLNSEWKNDYRHSEQTWSSLISVIRLKLKFHYFNAKNSLTRIERFVSIGDINLKVKKEHKTENY